MCGEVRVCASTPGTGTPTGYEGRRGTCSVVPMRIRRTIITVGSLPTISLMELEEEKQQQKKKKHPGETSLADSFSRPPRQHVDLGRMVRRESVCEGKVCG